MTQTFAEQNAQEARVAGKEQGAVWRWPFQNQAELRLALEEYSSFLDGTLTRHYGDPNDRGDGEIDPEVVMNAAKKRSEIDRCMEVLERTYPFYWRLLDLYYRCGASADVKGWITAAKRLGLRGVNCPSLVRCTMKSAADEPEDNRRDRPSCRAMVALSCLWDRDTFNAQVAEGIRRLFAVHEGRLGRPT